MARFKELFPGPAKTDALDTRRMLELLRHWQRIVQEVREVPLANSKLQRLTRRRRQLIAEKVRIVNRMQAELHAVCPGILAITRSASSRWFLGLLACRDDLRQLARFRSTTLRAILRIGVKHAAIITAWQRTAYFSEDVEWVGPMIIADARRLLVLLEEIQRFEKQITATAWPHSSTNA